MVYISLISNSKFTLYSFRFNGSFLEDFCCLGAGGVVRNHDGDWIAGFSHYEVGGDVLLAELCVIQIGLDFCSKKSYVKIIYESDCLEAVDLIIDGHDHTLHTYATNILHIRDVLHENGNTSLVHVLRNKTCVQILWLRNDHIQGALLTGYALRLTWNLSSSEITLELNFDSLSLFFLFASLNCNTTKKN